MRNNYQRFGENMFGPFGLFSGRPLPDLMSGAGATDIVRNEDGSTGIEIAMPGYNKNDIDICLEKGYLTVSAEKHQKEDGNGRNYIRREMSSSCRRTFYVGENMSENDITATYKDGVLRIGLPKDDSGKDGKHNIDIN